jgi:outer membrane protein assembly factor BamB
VANAGAAFPNARNATEGVPYRIGGFPLGFGIGSMISAEEFLAVLEQKDLLPAKVLESLKGQVRKSAKPIAAAAVAKLLIEKGLLTPALAQRLLSAGPKPPGRVEARPKPKPSAGPKKATDDDDFGLAPLDDDLGLAPLDDPTGLVPLEEPGGLVPLGEPEGLVPLDEPAGLAPLEDLAPLDDLTLLDEAPTPPAARKLPATAAKPSAPGAGSPASAKRPQAKPAQAPATKAAQPAATKPAGGGPSTPAPTSAPSRAGKPPVAPAATKPAAEKPSTPTPAAGGSLLDEELPELSSGIGLVPLDGLMDADAATLAGPLATPEQKKGRSEKKKRSKKGWDSALILVGGGALLGFLLLGGALLWWFSRQGADVILVQAEDDYRKGSYAQAIQKYDEFVAKYPTFPGASLARVHRGLAEMRQATDGSTDWARSLETAERVLKKISSETEFRNESQAELASLLPAIAQGLAQTAQKNLDQATVDQAQKTLKMVENPNLVSPSNRPATRLTDIEAMLALTQRQIDKGKELDRTVAGMNAAVGRGKDVEAYRIRDALLKQYPSLAADAKLQAAVQAVSQAERAAVKRVVQERAAQTKEPPGRIPVTVAMAARQSRSPPPESQDRVIFARAGGAVYGLDAATGKVLWRRWAGIEANDRTPAFPPTAVDDRPTSDALLVDAAGNAVLRVEAATGKLRWRQPIGERFDAYPVITLSQVLVATRSGRLVTIDLESGKSPGYVQIPQPLRVAPAVDPRGSTIYQVAEHSNLYVLSAETGAEKGDSPHLGEAPSGPFRQMGAVPFFRAREVVYLGHAPGSIVTPPVLVSRFLIVAENDRAAESRLRVFNVDGSRSEPLQEIRLPGHVVTPLVVSDLRVLAVTDTGSLGVFDVSGSDPKQPLVRVGEGVAATDSAPSGGGPGSLVRFPFLLGPQVLMADSQLTRYDVQSSRDRLQPTGIQDEASTTLQPLVAIGQTVFHVRRKEGMPGVLVSAWSAGDKPYWETALADPLVGEPIVDPTTRQVTAVTAAGSCFRLEATTLKDGKLIDQPAAALLPAEVRQPVSDVVRLDGGLLALRIKGSGVFVYAKDSGSAAASGQTKTPDPFIRLALPDPLACRPVSFAGGLLAPTKGGQVLLLDPASGANRAEPFQPRLQSGVPLAWQEPAVLGLDEFAVTDGRTNLYRVTIKTQPKLYLAVADTAKTPEPIVAPLAAVGRVVYAADARTLTAYELPKLSRGKQWPLSGRAVWGPRRIGQRVLLATDDDRLFCLTPDQKLLWQVPLAHGPLAGAPAESGGRYVLASVAGTVWTIDAQSGKEAAVEDLGCPLGSGPVPYGDQLLLAGRDGTLYLVAKP